MKELLVGLVLCLTASSALGQGRWLLVAGGSNASVVLDTTRIHTAPDGTLSIWVMISTAKRQLMAGKPVRSTVYHFGLNCVTQQVAVLSLVAYDSSSDPMLSGDVADITSWKDVRPDTYVESVMKFVCDPKVQRFLHVRS